MIWGKTIKYNKFLSPANKQINYRSLIEDKLTKMRNYNSFADEESKWAALEIESKSYEVNQKHRSKKKKVEKIEILESLTKLQKDIQKVMNEQKRIKNKTRDRLRKHIK